MSRDQRRYLLVVTVLVLAIGVSLAIMLRDRLPANPGGEVYEFVTDVDNWQRTERERVVTSRYDFRLEADLNQVPLQLGEWVGENTPQTNVEALILLEPEQYIQRKYRLPDGRYLWLSLIGSRKSKSFHSPQICYDTDGWKTEVGSVAVPLGEGEAYALRLVARKEFEGGATARHVITYFYLWPSYARNPQDGMVLVKLTAPAHESVDETVALEQQFFAELFIGTRP
jgi:hypothetical protein